jgi:hypothetical protein
MPISKLALRLLMSGCGSAWVSLNEASDDCGLIQDGIRLVLLPHFQKSDWHPRTCCQSNTINTTFHLVVLETIALAHDLTFAKCRSLPNCFLRRRHTDQRQWQRFLIGRRLCNFMSCQRDIVHAEAMITWQQFFPLLMTFKFWDLSLAS